MILSAALLYGLRRSAAQDRPGMAEGLLGDEQAAVIEAVCQ